MAFKDSNTRFKFYLPEARVLTQAEIDEISPETKQATGSDNRKGIWLEIYCPDAACMGDDGRITIPAVGHDSAEKKGTWLNIFCPEGSCELAEITDLP
jgi:hypothetical protein